MSQPQKVSVSRVDYHLIEEIIFSQDLAVEAG